MHVLVVGATGVLGQAVLPRLLEQGHRVTGLARTPEKLLSVDRLGAKAVRGDILDDGGLHGLLKEHRPDAVINLATAIPLSLKIRPKDWEMNDRIRAEGTLSLVRACEAADVALLLQESVGYVCTSRGPAWITEDSPRSGHSFLSPTIKMEDIVRASDVPSVLLRFGALMSAASWHTQQSVAALRRGMLPIIGDGASFLSLIHARDAADAICRIVEKPEIAGGKTYNVVDNEPAVMADVFPFAARTLKAPTPISIPPIIAKMAVGGLTLEILIASYRMSNARIREELGFKPKYPSYRETWEQIASSLGSRDIALSDDLR